MNTPTNTHHPRCHSNDHTPRRWNERGGERSGRPERAERRERPEHAEHAERPERRERRERFERGERPERGSADFTPRAFGRPGYGRRRFDPRDESADFDPRTSTQRGPKPHPAYRDQHCADHHPDHRATRRAERHTTHQTRRTARTTNSTGGPGTRTHDQPTTHDALTAAERAIRKLTHAYLRAVSTPDTTRRDQARAILATARRDLRTILTPEA